VRKLRKLKIGNVTLLDIVLEDYEATNPLSAALDAVEEARKRRTYHRVVVKNRTRKNKTKAHRTMDRRKMLAGWNRAAERLATAKRNAIEDGLVTRHNPLKLLSPQQAGELAENQRRLMIAKVGRPMNYKSDLKGAEFGKLLVWERLPAEINSVPQYLCLCVCGSAVAVAANLLVQRRKVSCRCVKNKTRRQRRWSLKKRLAAVGRKQRYARKYLGMTLSVRNGASIPKTARAFIHAVK
jgi:hypothetical protein